jgi:hypothetical protein
MSIHGPFYLVREVGTENYETGYAKYAVPKLYQKGPATSLVNSRNKQFAGRRTFEKVPVTLIFTQTI